MLPLVRPHMHLELNDIMLLINIHHVDRLLTEILSSIKKFKGSLFSFHLEASSSSEFPIDELLHSSLAGLNNVAFYMDTEEHPELISSQRNVAEGTPTICR